MSEILHNLKLVVCIPAYNEESTIAKVIIDTSRYSNLIIVCDDGSTDYTGIIAEKLGAIVVRHECNLGYGAALRTLFKKALEYKPDIVITLDADYQHDPSYIPKLIKPILDGEADVVIACRTRDDETPAYRRFAIKLLTNLLDKNVIDSQSGFRAYRADILEYLIPTSDGMDASIEIIDKALKHNLKISAVYVPFRYKGLKTSTYNPVSHGYSILSKIIHLKIIKRPITYLGLPGFVILLAGLISGLWVIKRYIDVRQLAIGTAIITAILIISGLLLLLIALQIYALRILSETSSSSSSS